MSTVKPVFLMATQKGQIFVFKTDYRFMQVKSIAEWERAFSNTFDLH